MASGWNLKCGAITSQVIGEDQYWSLFNRLCSNTSRKRSTYKYGLVKSILDNLLNTIPCDDGYRLYHKDLFAKFTENYWNLVVKYGLHQMMPDNKSDISSVERIILNAVSTAKVIQFVEFSSVDRRLTETVVQEVAKDCKKYVLGALYNDFEGYMFAFDLKQDYITISKGAYHYLLKFKADLEQLNYYAWAKFMEKIPANSDDKLCRLLDKMEVSTPQRTDLSPYRRVLQEEFEQSTCFYCGRKLGKVIHVDHFIPWSFTKEDKIWNFSLSCDSCNLKKNNKLPKVDLISKIKQRNIQLQSLENQLVIADFKSYTPTIIEDMWDYAQMSGFKVM